jgi:hypothetical protein
MLSLPDSFAELSDQIGWVGQSSCTVGLAYNVGGTTPWLAFGFRPSENFFDLVTGSLIGFARLLA